MTTSFRLGILETGRPPEGLETRYDPYPKMFENLLGVSAPKDWSYHAYPVLDDIFPDTVTECDAWLITGSRFGAYEDYPWIHRLKYFIQDAYKEGVPMVGICFGHQILAHSLGGHVEKSHKGWGLGAEQYSWTDGASDLLENAQIGAIEGDFTIQAVHQDQVIERPADATLLATSDFCENAALAYGNQVLSFQGHPEIDDVFVTDLIEVRRGRLFTDIVADKALAKNGTPLDNEAIGRMIVRFLSSNARLV